MTHISTRTFSIIFALSCWTCGKGYTVSDDFGHNNDQHGPYDQGPNGNTGSTYDYTFGNPVSVTATPQSPISAEVTINPSRSDMNGYMIIWSSSKTLQSCGESSDGTAYAMPSGTNPITTTIRGMKPGVTSSIRVCANYSNQSSAGTLGSVTLSGVDNSMCTGGGSLDAFGGTCTISTSISNINAPIYALGSINITAAGSLQGVTIKIDSMQSFSSLGTITGLVDIQAMSISISGAITADGKGYSGGGMNTAGEPSVGGGASATTGGGGGHGGAGGNGGGGAAGGLAFANTAPASMSHISRGAGGGGSSADVGGNGGGYIALTATNTIYVSGTLSANGANGVTVANASGGGAGGYVYMKAPSISGNATISANGGVGGDGSTADGGGGGGGVIYLSSQSPSMVCTVTAGLAGTGAGTNGTDGTVGFKSGC